MTKQSRSSKKTFNDSNGIDEWVLSPEQRELSEIIDSSTLTFVSGKAGTGKTAAVLHNFVRTYLSDKTKQIVVIRTPVEAGIDKIGALPGDKDEKLEPHFQSAKRILEQLLSKEKVKCDKDKRIHFKIPNFILGDTFDNSLIIVSEAQQMSPEILKLILERVGKDSTIVIEGDESQKYTSTGKRSGLSKTIELFHKNPTAGIDFFEFSVFNNMRSDFVQKINQVYESSDLF